MSEKYYARLKKYCATGPVNADFEALEKQLRYERLLYIGAVRDENEKPKKLMQIEQIHQSYLQMIKKRIDEFDTLYQETKKEVDSLGPFYITGNREFNEKEFKRYCKDFANRFGDWFWDERLTHNPLADGNKTITIRELQNYESNAWYPSMNDWMDMPYGARMLRIHRVWWDLTLAVLCNKGYSIPSKSLREMVNE